MLPLQHPNRGSATGHENTSPRSIARTICLTIGIGGLAIVQHGLGQTPFKLRETPGGPLFTTEWVGDPAKTYFIQYSKDLVHWEYSEDIYSGKNGPLLNRQDTENTPTHFVRLVETNQTAADPGLADFDNDGISNLVEIQQGTDPLVPNSRPDLPDHGKEDIKVSVRASALPDGALSDLKVLNDYPKGEATVSLSPSAAGHVSSGTLTWSSGNPGNHRGFLSPADAPIPGRAAIATIIPSANGELSTLVGFTSNGGLSGLSGATGMSSMLQRNVANTYNRLLSSAGSGQKVEMTSFINPDVAYRLMVRKEEDGFSSWIQGGIFDSMGAKVESSVWFPVSRWKGNNSTAPVKAGIYNSWVGPVQNPEFTDVVNPQMDSTSCLLDYERNKFGLHVPSLLKVGGGRVLAAWQNATAHESDDCVLKLSIRNRRGVWSPAVTVLDAGSDGSSNNGPVLHKVGDKIWLTYTSITNHVLTVRKRELSIEGGSFSLSEPVTLFNGALMLNHALTLSSGRLVACWHTASSMWKNRISYSDDNGLTWTSAVMPEFANRAGEGFAITEADGTLASYWRTDRGAIYRSVSTDDGATWSALVPTAIPCSNMPGHGLLGSRISGFKRPSDGKLVIVGSNSTTQREKLTAWLIENGTIVGTQSLLPWDVGDGTAEGLHYPDVVVHADDSMTIIFARWLGGGFGSAELHSAINTFRVPAAFQ